MFIQISPDPCSMFTQISSDPCNIFTQISSYPCSMFNTNLFSSFRFVYTFFFTLNMYPHQSCF
jgi:hypothetical protein